MNIQFATNNTTFNTILRLRISTSSSPYIIDRKENCFGVIKMNYSNTINTIYFVALLIFILIDKK
jgi:hypothetical protein